MPIEFREIRLNEMESALAFAAEQGADVSRPAVRHQLSLLATNAEQTILGSALHEISDDGRRQILIHLKPDTHPGLGRLLIDRALRKAEAADLATAHVAIHQGEVDQATWHAADWLSRLRPAQSAAPVETPVKPPDNNAPRDRDTQASDTPESPTAEADAA